MPKVQQDHASTRTTQLYDRILDAFSRKVIGYAISRSMDARIAVAALKAAIRARPAAQGLHPSF
jgi:transposase InsO family protein